MVKAICGTRTHSHWFGIGGLSEDLPKGWDVSIREFLRYLPPRLIEYDRGVMQNRIFKARTQGVGTFTANEAIEWGVTGPNLRACGLEWDFRKKQPYSSYEQFDFDIPTGQHGDCYDRSVVRVEEMRQSMRIIEQCVNNMPEGTYRSQPLACPPPSQRTAIDAPIMHFEDVNQRPAFPPGEALGAIEGAQGNNGYYLVSDGGTTSYRTRIRTPSFAHLQMFPRLARGRTMPDMYAILGAMNVTLADVDR
jgi:NADH-quinone oxidoreductase subunit C/D